MIYMKALDVKTIEHDYPSRLKLSTIKYDNITVYVSTIDTHLRRKENRTLAELDKILGYTHNYETAIWYQIQTPFARSKIAVVETYQTVEEALEGHKKWINEVLKGRKHFKDVSNVFTLTLP